MASYPGRVDSTCAGEPPSGGLEVALRARGLRATPQRRLVHDAVTALGHATPEQVCSRVQQIAPGVNLSTVYRALELLEELGVVARTRLGPGAPTYFPAAHADHVHLVCRRCGRVGEVDVAAVAALAAGVTRDTGFVPDLAHLALPGTCAACLSASVSAPAVEA